jgi:hypothetical protein
VFGLVFAFPAAWLVQTGTTLGIVAAFVGGLGLIYGWVYGPARGVLERAVRHPLPYSALSTLVPGLGHRRLGLTPLIAAWLVQLGDGTLWLVASYNVVVALISLLSCGPLPETRGRDLEVRRDECEPSGSS